MKTEKKIHQHGMIEAALLLLTSVFILSGCDLIGSDSEEKKADELFNGISFTVTGSSQLPALAVSGNGQSMSIISEVGGVQPTGAVFNDANGRSLVVYADQQGFPRRITSSNHIYVLDTYNAGLNKIDVGVINPAGEIQILRNLEFDNTYHQSLSTNYTEIGSPVAWKFAAVALKTAATVTSLTGTDNFSGLIKNSGLISTGLLLTEGDKEALKASASGLTSVATSFGCAEGDLSGCTSLMANLCESHFITSKNEIESKQDVIAVTEGALDTGFGDVQVTLTWDTAVDLDLWVTDTEGEVIYFGNAQSGTGGRLDRDDMDGFGPENIFWESGTAPAGEYKVEVDYYSGSPVTNYTVLVQAFGHVKSFTGQIRPDETILVTTFSESGISKEMPSFVQKSAQFTGVK